MKTKSQLIAEEIAAKHALASVIVAKGAEATDDELAQATALYDEIDGLETRRKAAVELEAKAAAGAALVEKLSTEKATANVKHAANQPAFTAPPAGQTAQVVPHYRGQLKSFKGPDAQRDAYGFGQWFLATLNPERFAKSAEWCRANGIEMKVHNESVNSQGGYLVPHQFENALIDLREMYGVFRRNARVVPMTSDTRSDPRRAGGLTAYWAGESDTLTQSTKAWDRVNLTAKKLTCLARITSELSEDAVIGVADDLASEIAYAFAVAEDAAGFVGDGTSTYGHIVGASTALKNLSATIANIAGLVVATGTGYATSYGSVALADFNGVKAKLPQYARAQGAKWYVSSTFYYSIMEKLAVAAGGVTEQGIANGAPLRFLGDPVEITQAMPSNPAVSQVVALYGWLAGGARLGDRRATTLALSEHSRFANDEIEIKGTERLDIVVHDVGNASATAGLRVPGPIVGLITAAS